MTQWATTLDLHWLGILPFTYKTLDFILYTNVHFMGTLSGQDKPTILNAVQVVVFVEGAELGMARGM